jgi:RimJ/RimL family protein N-acetyltransferase
VSSRQRADVSLRPWSDGDLGLLERLLGDRELMAHLGGPESPEAIRARHERYLRADAASGGLYAIVAGSDSVAAGWVGFWATEWAGDMVWECGWHVLPEFQRMGVATAAVALTVESARARGTYRYLHAFPSVDNVASNALCRRAGFVLLGEADVEYPIGQLMRSNNWRFDLLGDSQS